MAQRYGLDITVKGLDIAESRLQRLGIKASRTKPVLNRIVDVLLEENQRRWGRGWKADSAATRATKRKRGKGRQTGTYSGALKASLTKRGAKGQVLKITNEYVELGSNLPYAKAFDRGRPPTTAGGKNRQPKRKLIRIGTGARVSIRELILEHLTE